MAKHIKQEGQRNWSNVSASDVTSAHWPFRYCNIEEAESCEEIFGVELWDRIQSKNNQTECINTWNTRQMLSCRQMVSNKEFNGGNSHDLARNLFNLLLLRYMYFEESFVAQQKISLQPFEIYVAPNCYVEYKPHVDICLLDSTGDRSICFNIIEKGSKQDIEDCFYQTMFSTLSGCRSAAYCYVIKETTGGCFKVFLGMIEWPPDMLQMMMICGTDVSRQLGFNHFVHSKNIVSKYAYLGKIDCNQNDCPGLTLFLNSIDILSTVETLKFLPLTKSMQVVVDKRKASKNHISKCILDCEKICNDKFEQFGSS